MTPWASQVDTNSPLPEYPRPQMVRSNWLSLNGIWQFQAGAVGDPVPTHQTLAGEILVPFPMESAISGDFPRKNESRKQDFVRTGIPAEALSVESVF